MEHLAEPAMNVRQVSSELVMLLDFEFPTYLGTLFLCLGLVLVLPLVLYPPFFLGCLLLYLRSLKGGCCSISDDLSSSYVLRMNKSSKNLISKTKSKRCRIFPVHS